MAKQCWSQTVLESGSWGHSVLQTPALVYPFFFLSHKIFRHKFLSSCESQGLQICIHLQRFEVYHVKENHNAEIYFASFFSFFSISHSIVMHREIYVKDFTWTTAPRILKFGTNIGYDYTTTSL